MSDWNVGGMTAVFFCYHRSFFILVTHGDRDDHS